jgi:hypothetical protein
MTTNWHDVLRRFEQSESKHQALLSRAAADPRTTWWVRREHILHRPGTLGRHLAHVRDGVPLEGQARLGWFARRWEIELAIAQMRDQCDRKLLGERNLHMFGSVAVPPLEWLKANAKQMGLDETAQYEAVVQWVLRPDLYSYRWVDPGGAEFKRLKRFKNGDPKLLKSPVEFSVTENPECPLRAIVKGQIWDIRVNEFPDLPLYSLLIDGIDVMDFDNWPKRWSRPTRDCGEPAAAILSVLLQTAEHRSGKVKP